MRDYKDKNSYSKLGLRKGKPGVKTGRRLDLKTRIFIWVGLFFMVFIINYLFFMHFKPLRIQGIEGIEPDNYKSSAVFESWVEKACDLQEQGDLTGAYEAFSKAIRERPEESSAYVKRGVVCVKMQDYDKAIKDLKSAISLNPGCAEAFIKRGLVYLEQKNFDYAINDCNYALSMDPEMSEAYYVRGIAFREKGLTDEAKKDFKRSCELGNNIGCQEYEEILYIMNDWT